MSEQLKPCPFCGKEDVEIVEIRNPDVWWDSNLRGEHCFAIICTWCNATIKEENRGEVIKMWNRRADQ